MKRKGIADAIGFNVNHPHRTSSRNALSVSSVTWFVIFCCGKLIAFLQKNKPSPFVVKNTVLGIFHPHALTANAQGEDSKEVKKWRNDMRKWILIMAVMMFICETRAEKISCVNGKYANGADCQSCGTNCNWSFDTNSGHLEVSGGTDGTIGTMADFTYYNDESTTQPWDQYRYSIISLKVSGIENIGDNAFVFARHLKEIKLDDAITNIGMAAFNTTSLQSITLPDSLNKIEDYAFENTPLQSVVISDALTNIELIPFSRELNVIENLQIVCRGENCDAVKEVLSNYVYYNQISEKWETTDVLSKALSLAGESQCNSSGYYWDGASCQGKKNGINCQGNYRQNNDYCNRIIYTIDEANKVAGNKNRVSITYR